MTRGVAHDSLCLFSSVGSFIWNQQGWHSRGWQLIDPSGSGDIVAPPVSICSTYQFRRPHGGKFSNMQADAVTCKLMRYDKPGS